MAALRTAVNAAVGCAQRCDSPDAGEVLAEGRVLHRGRRVATAEGSVRRASDGKLLAHGSSTCMIL
jgi:acyl-coenzyme A thioesterase PaaI-like protein